MDIEQCIYYNIVTVVVHNPVNKPTTQCTYHHIQCTLQPTAAIYNHLHYSSAIQCTLQHTATLCNLQPSIQYISSAHYIFSAHCSTLQPSATYSQASSIYPVHITSSVHTAANCSHLQPPTLQLCHSVHTAAIMYDANTIQYIQ